MQAQEQINLFIAEQPEWQRKLMIRLRQLIHSTDETIEEVWRGNAPHFESGSMVLSMHPLKTCVSIWFHKGSSLRDASGLFKLTDKDEERELRKYKLEEGESVNEKAFVDLLKLALKQGRPTTRASESRNGKQTSALPQDLQHVLQHDEDAWERWNTLSATCQQEYVEWVTDAKQDEARKRRIAKALELIREGLSMSEAFKVG